MSVQEVSFAWYKGAAQNEPSHLQGSKSQTGLSPCQNCLTTVVQKIIMHIFKTINWTKIHYAKQTGFTYHV